MSYDEIVRIGLIGMMVVLGLIVITHMYLWDTDKKSSFEFEDFFTAPDKKGKNRASRPALGEMVALFATTFSYLATLSVKPELFELATLVYGGLWVVRGGYATYVKSKAK